MRITETLMAPGSWSLRLRPSSGMSIRNQLDAAIASYDAAADEWTPTLDGFVAVFEAPPVVPSLAAARYVGVLLGRDGATGYAGEGLASLLNRSNGIGHVATADTVYASQNLSAWLDDILPVNGITKGTVTTTGLSSAAATWRVGQGAREFLSEVCRLVGSAEWRINPDGTMDAARAGALFRAGEVLVSPEPNSSIGAIRGVHGGVVGFRLDGSAVASKAVVAGQGEGDAMIVSTATAGTARVYGLDGAAATMTALVNAPSSDATNSAALASATLALRAGPRDEFRVAIDDQHAWWYIAAGDTIYVWDPEAGIGDGGAVPWHGGIAYPQVKRVHSISGPVPPDASVWLWRSSVDEWTDITSQLDLEPGTLFAVVGQGRGGVDWAGSQGPAWLGETSQVIS